MSDFCRQCALAIFGEGFDKDLAGRSKPEDTEKGLYAVALCEGCGPTLVDHEGRCVSFDCLEGHNMAKTILIDFDGTLNSYATPFDVERPWHLPDPPLKGAIAFVRRLASIPPYKPVIFTTRALDMEGMGNNVKVQTAIHEWLERYGLEAAVARAIEVTALKIPCSLIIDDNAFRFEGAYPSADQLVKLTASRRHKR